jgi:hypothetical protein
MHYKVWRLRDNLLHVMCFDGHFDELPDRIRHLGPWVGARSGAVENLKLHYRLLLAEQGFVVICSKPSALRLEPR